MCSTVNVLLNIIYLNCGLINEEKIDIRSNELHLSSITFVYDEQKWRLRGARALSMPLDFQGEQNITIRLRMFEACLTLSIG